MDFSHSRRPFSFPMKGVMKKNTVLRKGDDILIIQTSSVGTSASRKYSYAQTNYTEHSKWDNATGDFFQETCSEAIRKNEESYSRHGAAFFLEENQEEAIDAPSDSAEDTEMVALKNRLSPLQAKGIPTIQEQLEMVRDIRQKALDYLLRVLFHDDGKYVDAPNSIDRTTTPGEASANNPVTIAANEMGQNLGTGESYYSFYYCAESETTCFDTKGTAITADGRQLDFHISLKMSRSFVEMSENKIDFGQPRLCDPLVINLNTNVASVSDQKFFFDIDADGTEEEISMLGKGSGYLALDTNADGIINDGSELFGTQSGNGFKDLLAHDEDGNGWIDEADSIFQKLKIWSMDENGNSTLIDLKEAGVGAIYLGYENTEFSLKNEAHETNAVIQKTGLFLYDDGRSGTMQQLDLAV